MSGSGEPLLVWAPEPCPRCGARNVDEAATRCRPSRDETGEATCPAEREDAAGVLLQPTAQSLAALDAWIGELMRAEDCA